MKFFNSLRPLNIMVAGEWLTCSEAKGMQEKVAGALTHLTGESGIDHCQERRHGTSSMKGTQRRVVHVRHCCNPLFSLASRKRHLHCTRTIM